MAGPSLLSRLASTLLHPLTPQDVLSLLDPVHSSRQLRGVVTSVTRATPGFTDSVAELGIGMMVDLARGVTRARRHEFEQELKTLELGLEHRLGAKVGLLSGGQRQALSLLMATFSGPKILLLDEHTAALDPSRAELVTRLTRQVVAEHRLTTLMVTHNMSQALEVGNRLIMMHDGRIILELDEQEKAGRTPADLLAEFGKIKGAVVGGVADRGDDPHVLVVVELVNHQVVDAGGLEAAIHGQDLARDVRRLVRA